jgi:hypothetical protein
MLNELKVMEEVLSLQETAELLKLPAGSVRLGRHDCAGLTPIRFANTPNAPLYYLREEVYSILRNRARMIEQIKNLKNGGRKP